jgi:hypothetical protein
MKRAAPWFVAGLVLAASARGEAPPAASQPDRYVVRPRIVVMTDIANEPDDQMSMVPLPALLERVRRRGARRHHLDLDEEQGPARRHPLAPRRLRGRAAEPAEARARLSGRCGAAGGGRVRAAVLRHGRSRIRKSSPGSELILLAAAKPDARPLWVLGWGGTNTLAQALLDARASRTPQELEELVARLRVYTISDQDDAGPWLRREFPSLRYVASPSTQDGEEYAYATWTGISGDRFYKNAPGADFTTFTDDWVNANVRSKGPLGKLYPFPCCIHEGDTPSFLGLIDNGLASAMSPAWGGWGGRYVWRQPSGETRPFWTQGGDSYPGRDSSRDTVLGSDGKSYTSDQATIWRWRTAFQNDFAARLDWSIKDAKGANHNPDVVVNGRRGREPVEVEALVGQPLKLDAAGTTDPDGDALRFGWFFYAEAGAGIPGQPLVVRRRPPASGAVPPGEGGIPSAPSGGPREPPPRLVVDNASTALAIVTPKAEGIAHVILAVEDSGTPSLTSYRRIVIRIKPRAQ